MIYNQKAFNIKIKTLIIVCLMKKDYRFKRQRKKFYQYLNNLSLCLRFKTLSFFTKYKLKAYILASIEFQIDL